MACLSLLFSVFCFIFSIVFSAQINHFSITGNTFDLTNQHRQSAVLRFSINGTNVTDVHYSKDHHNREDKSEIIVNFTDGSQMYIGELNYDPNNTEYMLVWSKNEPNLEKELCFHYGFNNASWFSTYEEKNQKWPMDTQKIIPKGKAFTTSDFLLTPDFGSIIEHVFVNTDGFGIVLNEYHPWILRRDSNHGDPILCVSTSNLKPYPNQTTYSNPHFFDTYIHFRIANNITMVWNRLHHTHIYPPKSIPDERMFRYPIWSTWAYFKKEVNQSKVLQFANEIVKHGFKNNAQLEIDDFWEHHYGDLTFDTTKFPDAKHMITELKKLGFRVTVWMTPFITKESTTYNASIPHLVKSHDGHPLTSKWNSAGIVDFSNDHAAKWWIDRLNHFRNESGVDGFKMDNGEVYWYGDDFIVNDHKVREYANWVTTRYVETCSKLGPMTEVRSAFKNQHTTVFLRMMDKNTVWEGENGLASLISTALTMSLAGYSFILPDMIGGNDEKPAEELFIRWVQATTFLPSMQFSYPPWIYSEKAVNLTLKYVQLHAEHGDTIITLAKRRVTHSEPVIRPLWYSEPNDSRTFKINDQFMLGPDIVVAPVLEKGKTERSVYLPSGVWVDQHGKENTGPAIIKVLSPIEELPYFKRKH